MELTCRVCLQDEELMVHIYDEVEDLQSNLSVLLEKCGGLKVEKNDRFPKYLCKECTTELLIAAKFREKCTHSQKILHQVEADLQTAAAQEQMLLEAEPADDNIQAEAQKQGKCTTVPLLIQMDMEEQFNDLEDAQQPYEYVKEEVEVREQESALKYGSIECVIEPVIAESLETDVCEIEMKENVAEQFIQATEQFSENDMVEICTSSSAQSTLLKLECDMCGAAFALAINLQRHLEKTHMAQQLFSCNQCGYCCTSEEQCEQHCSSCEGTQPRSPRSVKVPADGKKKTKQAHAGCRKSTVRRQSSGARDNTCDNCGKQLQSQFALNMHLRTHTGDRPYACEFCDKAFKTQSALTTHLKRHAGLPDYACDVCDKKFYETSNLTAHMRTHTGDRPQKCRICGKCFTRVFLLQLHMRTHTKEKPYQCSQCERAFAQLCDLKNHFRTHTGERRVRCPVCPKTFNTDQACSWHLKKHHPLDAVLGDIPAATTAEQDNEEAEEQCDIIEFGFIKVDDYSNNQDLNTTHVLNQSLSLSDIIVEDCITDFITPCQ